MSTNWIPDVGELFYIKKADKKTEWPSFDGTVTVTTEKNDSWKGSIFKMVAHDDTLIIAEMVYGVSFTKGAPPYAHFRKDSTCTPVGPTVVKALGLA